MLGLFFGCAPKPGQKISTSVFTEIDAKMRAKDFSGAENLLKKMIAENPGNADALYRLGAIKYAQTNFVQADSLLILAADLTSYQNEEYLHAAMLAADANDNYQRSGDLSHKYLLLPERQNARIKRAQSISERSKKIKGYIEAPTDVELVKLNESINSVNHEYLPFVSLNGQNLYFVRRENNLEHIYKSEGQGFQWANAHKAELWDDLPNAGAFALSSDGIRAVVTICGNNGLGSCDLYLRKKVKDTWSPPKNMGDVINSQNWDSQPFFSADGGTLFFSSDRNGGYGGRDLYYVRLKNGVWSEPVNMGPNINTAGNEESPFIHPDGSTFYFRSDQWDGMGGFDVFISRLGEDFMALQEPVNLGYPINSTKDDGAFTIAPDGKTAFITTDRMNIGNGGRPHLDILGLELPENLRSIPTSWVSFNVFDRMSGEGVPAAFELVDLQSDKILASGVSIPWEKVVLPIKTGTRLGLFVRNETYLPFSKNFYVNEVNDPNFPHVIAVGLEKLISESTFVLNNIFFETNAAVLLPESRPELIRLKEVLLENPGYKLEITGHTDDVGSVENNLRLSLERAKAVAMFLEKEGVGKERLSYYGKGESEPIANNNTEEGRQANRRTSFKLLKINN